MLLFVQDQILLLNGTISCSSCSSFDIEDNTLKCTSSRDTIDVLLGWKEVTRTLESNRSSGLRPYSETSTISRAQNSSSAVVK